MLNIFFLIIIIVSLAGMVYLFFRKFPQLSSLDLDNLPEEKISRKKKEIIKKMVEKRSEGAKKQFAKLAVPLKKTWDFIQTKFRIYVYKIHTLWHHEQVVKTKKEIEAIPEEKDEKLKQLIYQAEESYKTEDYDGAEDLFISAISIDPRSAVAYRGLGDTYLAKKSIEEARQTYRFLARLEPDDDSAFVKLAEIAESQGDLEEAIEYYQQAVLINDSFSKRFYHLAELLIKVEQPQTAKEAILQAISLESQNPKYLDLMIEIAIICGDKGTALQGYNNLRLVNLDNQKLNSFKDRIDKIR
jgi:tetratricopeptide (TPR) repeat protein